MPESIVVQQARSRASLDPVAQRAIAERKRLLEALPPYSAPGPMSASTCYVWPTDDCSVGCAHCNFASPRSSKFLDRYRIADDVDRVLELVNGMGLWKAVLSGGGEPMEEPLFCRNFIAYVDSAQLAEIELITSASFASTPADTARELELLVDAWHSRGSSSDVGFTIRLSVDWFHAKRIGLQPAANVLRALSRPEFADVGCYIRSVLLDGDTTLAELAASLGAHLGPIKDYCQTMTMPDGRDVLAYHKNLIIDGRMTQRRLRSLPISLPEASRAETFGRRFRSPAGKHVPARVYNGPEVVHLDGLACIVEAAGGIKILEGNHPHRYPTLCDTASWPEARRFLYADPLTVTLVDGGPDALVELIAHEYPHAGEVTTATNQLYYLSDRILDDPLVALLATVRAVEQHIGAGALDAEAAGPAAEARAAWQQMRSYGPAAR